MNVAPLCWLIVLVSVGSLFGQNDNIVFGPWGVKIYNHNRQDSINLAGTESNFSHGYTGSYAEWIRDTACDPNTIQWCGDAVGYITGFPHEYPRTSDTIRSWEKRVDSIIKNWTAVWKGHSTWGLLVGAENSAVYDTSFYYGTEYVCKKLKAEDSTLKTMAQGGIRGSNKFCLPALFDSCPDLDVLAFSQYRFRGSSPTSDQTALLDFVDYYAECNQKMRHPHNLNRHHPMAWYAIIQTHREYRVFPKSAPIRLWGKYYRLFRRPTAEEIRCQGFLALAYGAHGVLYYTYPSDTLPPDPDSYPTSRDSYWYPYYKNIKNAGLVDVNDYPYDYRHHPGDTTFDAVKHLNQDLKIVGPIFKTITWDTATSITPAQPFHGLRYISALGNAKTGTPVDSLYLELATFVDRQGRNYFLLVNRKTTVQDTVLVWVQITSTNRNRTPRLIDQLTKKAVSVQNRTSGFLIPIEPGNGRLFKINF